MREDVKVEQPTGSQPNIEGCAIANCETAPYRSSTIPGWRSVWWLFVWRLPEISWAYLLSTSPRASPPIYTFPSPQYLARGTLTSIALSKVAQHARSDHTELARSKPCFKTLIGWVALAISRLVEPTEEEWSDGHNSEHVSYQGAAQDFRMRFLLTDVQDPLGEDTSPLVMAIMLDDDTQSRDMATRISASGS
jgi:hypothetical protein